MSTEFSPIEKEAEVLLPPGYTFEVMGVLPQGALPIVQLCEIPSNPWIRNLQDKAKLDVDKDV